MLSPHFGDSDRARWAETWDELGHGAPTLAGFARLCSLSLARGGPIVEGMTDGLSHEAKAILVAARDRGVIEIKGANQAFDAPARLLAVYVETNGAPCLFRRKRKPETTIRFLAGFRELCETGLAMHHTFGEFSLTREGFDLARTIEAAAYAADLNWAKDEDAYA